MRKKEHITRTEFDAFNMERYKEIDMIGMIYEKSF